MSPARSDDLTQLIHRPLAQICRGECVIPPRMTCVRSGMACVGLGWRERVAPR